MNQSSSKSQSHGQPAESHDTSARLRTDLNVTWTAIVGFVGAILIFVFIILIQILFQRTEHAEFQQKIVAEVSARLAQLRAQQVERLNSYRLANEKEGVVAIPIEQAMQLVARDPAARSVAAAQPVGQTLPGTQTQSANQTQAAGTTQPTISAQPPAGPAAAPSSGGPSQ